MAIELVPLATARIQLAAPIALPQTPKGTRQIFEFTEVTVEGDRVRGKMKGSSAADWTLVSPDGTGALDIRYTLETDDGALVYLAYQGRVDVSAGLGSPVYSAPLFETGDERYAWLNKIQAVAKGTVSPELVLTLEMFEVC
jgi:Protein of unknown function (DUF3237)